MSGFARVNFLPHPIYKQSQSTLILRFEYYMSSIFTFHTTCFTYFHR